MFSVECDKNRNEFTVERRNMWNICTENDITDKKEKGEVLTENAKNSSDQTSDDLLRLIVDEIMSNSRT